MTKINNAGVETGFTLLLSTSKGSISRKKILTLLRSDAKGCNEVALHLELNWRTVYRHLKLLEKYELVKVTDFGQRKFYQITQKGEIAFQKSNTNTTNMINTKLNAAK